jgi:copper(I)-binding protein
MNKFFQTTALIAALAAGSAFAQTAAVKVEGAWARASVPGQKGTGAFMKLTAKDGARLVGASSPVAGVTEVHEMKMEGDVMKMRAVPALELPAGKPVELKPGGYHVMLLDLKAPLAKDTVVPITLVFKDSKGAESKLELKVPVSATAPAQAGAAAMMDGHKH